MSPHPLTKPCRAAGSIHHGPDCPVCQGSGRESRMSWPGLGDFTFKALSLVAALVLGALFIVGTLFEMFP